MRPQSDDHVLRKVFGETKAYGVSTSTSHAGLWPLQDVASSASAHLLPVRPSPGAVVNRSLTGKIRHFAFSTNLGTPPSLFGGTLLHEIHSPGPITRSRTQLSIVWTRDSK